MSMTGMDTRPPILFTQTHFGRPQTLGGRTEKLSCVSCWVTQQVWYLPEHCWPVREHVILQWSMGWLKCATTQYC